MASVLLGGHTGPPWPTWPRHSLPLPTTRSEPRERERGRERERREREREREERALAQRVTTLKHFQPPLRFWISLLTCDGGREGMARS